MANTTSTHSMHAGRFALSDCVQWIDSIKANNVCLYFLPQFYCLASEIATKLKQQCPETNFLVMISGSSGVDTVKFRTRDPKYTPDGVIYFGASCLCPAKYSRELPILFIPLTRDTSEFEYITECIVQSNTTGSSAKRKILLVADLTNSSILLNEHHQLASRSNCSLDVCRLVRPEANNWHFPDGCSKLFVEPTNTTNCLYVPYSIPSQLSHYDLVVFVGECNNLEFILNCKRLVVINPQKRNTETFDGPKEFRKRSSLIEKFKSQSGQLTGVVFVNYTHSVTPIMNRAKLCCKKLKKMPYFLTLNQADFEMRLGNFGQLESFVLVNACECNFEVARNTAKYLYPIIFWKEFLIVCRQRISYGGIEWNAPSADENERTSDQEEEEEEEKDEENMKLVERDLFKRPDGWFGLVVDAGSQQAGQIKEGLRGIPSSYMNEEELF